LGSTVLPILENRSIGHKNNLPKVMDLETWLSQREEEPSIEPDIPIVDTHHHLWEGLPNLHDDFRPPDNIVEKFGERVMIGRRFMPEEMRSGFLNHRIVGTVFAECSSFYDKENPKIHLRPVGETKKIESIADECGILGIVAGIDLTLNEKDLAEAISAHKRASPRLVGFRQRANVDPDGKILSKAPKITEDHLAKPAVIRGAKQLARDEKELTLDVWVFHFQIKYVAQLARAVPELKIVLDHFGGPLGIQGYKGEDTRMKVFGEWKTAIIDLAKCPNIVVKLGGLGMPLCGFDFHRRTEPPSSEEVAEAFLPWIRHTIEQFGVRRCMFETNFPMDRVSYSYNTNWNAFKLVAKKLNLSEEAVHFLCSRTAIETYSLKTQTSNL